MLTDPIADMLTRIRNGARARKAVVDVPWSRIKEAVARVLVDEGFLTESARVDDGPHPLLRLGLRYDDQRRSAITGIERVSRPSLRVYVGSQEIPSIRRGLGINILSTPRGVLVDREARRLGVGGELLCAVW